MRVVVNVTPLLAPLTGIGHYTHQLLLAMREHPQLEELVGISAVQRYNQEQLDSLLADVGKPPATPSGDQPASNKPNHLLRALRLARHVPGARRAKRAMEQVIAKRSQRHLDSFVYWEPNYTLLPLNNPAVLTVHDLSHIHYRHYHPEDRVALLEQQLDESLARAQHLIGVSEYTKSDMVASLGLKPEQISVVSPAVSDDFRQVYNQQQRDTVCQRYGLPQQYLLSVATLEPRKNIEGLIRAFSQLPQALRKDFPLVLVGARGWLTESLEALLTPLLETGEVIRLGYVEQADLPIIYQAATCLCYVSFFEGFGMPVAEAMAAGTAVITSNTSSMPEVAAGAACLVDPEQVEEIREALLSVLSDQALRVSMEQQGQQVAAAYTWQNSANKLVDILAKQCS